MKIALLGASGRVGQAFLTQAAADERFDIFALIRSQHADLPLSKDRTVMGNACRLEDVKKIMENAEIVISCLGTDGDDTLSTAMAHILSAMEEQHIKRLITIGTAGILDSDMNRENTGLKQMNRNESRPAQPRSMQKYTKCLNNHH